MIETKDSSIETVMAEGAKLPPDSATGGNDYQFRRSVESRLDKESQILERYILIMTAIILAMATVAWSLTYGRIWLGYYRLGTENDYLAEVIADLWLKAVYMQGISTGLLALLLIAGILLLLFFYRSINASIGRFFILGFFDRPTHREFFQKVMKQELKPMKKAGYLSLFLFAILAVGLVAYGIGTSYSRHDMFVQAFVDGIATPILVSGLLFVLVVSFPVLFFYSRQLRADHKINDTSLRGYLVYLTAQWAWLPLLIFLLIEIVLPDIFNTHGHIYHNYIHPYFEPQIIAKRDAVMELPITSKDQSQRRDAMLERFDEIVFNDLSAYGSIISSDHELFKTVLPRVLQVVAWLALAMVAALFVTPYFAFGGVQKGLLYVVIVLAAFKMENILQEDAHIWFSLPKESTRTWLLIAFVVFVNALFFDWLAELFTDDKKVCPECRTSIDGDNEFCPYCGIEQPVKHHYSLLARGEHWITTHLKLDSLRYFSDFLLQSLEISLARIGGNLSRNSPATEFSETKHSRRSQILLLSACLLVIAIVLGLRFVVGLQQPAWTTREMRVLQSYPLLDYQKPLALVWDGDSIWWTDDSELLHKPVSFEQSQKAIEHGGDLCMVGTAIWADQLLWCSDEDARYINQINPKNGELLQQIDNPDKNVKPGLAWDGEYLWATSQEPYQLVKFNPQTGEPALSLAGPIPPTYKSPAGGQDGSVLRVVDLAWDGSTLWAIVWAGDLACDLLKIDPRDGSIIDAYHIPEIVFSSVAWDGQSLWAVNGIVGRIYQLSVPD